MRSARTARGWHAATAAVAAFALGAQLVLVVLADSVPADEPAQSLPERLLHFVSYFTVLSNALVLGTTLRAARNPHTDGGVWRVLRLDAVVAIAVTGLVHWFLLRPLLSLEGWSYAIDKLLHVVVPLLAVLGWLLFGPRPRVTAREVLYALVYPVGWLGYTLVVGAASGWYPYPFVDVPEQGAAAVAAACVGVTALILAVSALVWLGDRRMAPAPRPRGVAER